MFQVRLCKQLCGPTFLKKCPSVVDELESLYGDLQQQLVSPAVCISVPYYRRDQYILYLCTCMFAAIDRRKQSWK